MRRRRGAGRPPPPAERPGRRRSPRLLGGETGCHRQAGPGSGLASRAAPRRRPGQAAGCWAIFTPDPVALVRGLLHLGTGEPEAAALPAPGAWLQGAWPRVAAGAWPRGRGFGGGAARVPLVHSHGGTFSSFLKRKI